MQPVVPLPVDATLLAEETTVDPTEVVETPLDEAELLEELPGPVDDTAPPMPLVDELAPPVPATPDDAWLPDTVSPPWPPWPDAPGVQPSTPMICPHPTAAAASAAAPIANRARCLFFLPHFKPVFTLIGFR
jgi:hypothetical protein